MRDNDKETSKRRIKSHAQRDKQQKELQEEQQKSLKPHNHAFSVVSTNSPACFYCGEAKSHHQQYVDCSTGTRIVKEVE